MAIAIRALNESTNVTVRVACSVACSRKHCFRAIHCGNSDKADMCCRRIGYG